MPAAARPFLNLDEAALRALAPRGAVRSFPKAAVVVNEGDETDSLYVVLSGRVKAFVSEEDGKELVMGTVGAGEYFGEVVLDGGPRSVSIMTLEPSRFFIIPRSDVERMIERNPAFARDLIRKLNGMVRNLTTKVRDLAMRDVYGRFVRFVDQHAVEQNGKRIVGERLTQQDIAVRIGGSRETVNRMLKELSAGGYVSIRAKRITIHRNLPASW